MTDRQAIRVLEKCVELLRHDSDTENDMSEEYDVLQQAIEALQKRIPLPPVVVTGGTGLVTKCPTCKAVLRDPEWSLNYKLKHHVRFCICCGQFLTELTPIGWQGEKYIGRGGEK